MKKIALVHATPLAIEPIHHAFSASWPDAELMNLLDDSLSKDRNRIHDDEIFFEERIAALAHYAMKCRADGILFTCSAFGDAIEKVANAQHIPILKPNEGMFRLALEQGRKIGMVATFKPAVKGMVDEFEMMKHELGIPEATLETVLVEDGRQALAEGNVEAHNQLVAEAVANMPACDAYMLAHFSTACAKDTVEKKTNKMVLSSPEGAVSLLKKRFSQE